MVDAGAAFLTGGADISGDSFIMKYDLKGVAKGVATCGAFLKMPNSKTCRTTAPSRHCMVEDYHNFAPPRHFKF